MLTNFYYYNYYKPYMIRDYYGTNTKGYKRSVTYENFPYNENYSVALNKAYKKDVVQYAHHVYQNVIGFKNSVKNILGDIKDINRAAEDSDTNELNESLDYFYEDLASFIKSYNDSIGFDDGENQSKDFSVFAKEVKNVVDYLYHTLIHIGAQKDADGRLFLNNDNRLQASTKNVGELTSKINESISLFGECYDKTRDMLEKPMAEHMGFKSLKYYYNYKYDKIETDTFKLIESGMLVNLAL